MLGSPWPSYSQTSLPSSLWTALGARSSYFLGSLPSNSPGGSTTWSSTLTRIRSSTFTIGPPCPWLVLQAEDAHGVAGQDLLPLLGGQVGHGVVDHLARVRPVV